MYLDDSVIGFYAGLDEEGHVIQVFANIEGALENADDGVVSIGYVQGIPVDYDELFAVPEEDQQ